MKVCVSVLGRFHAFDLARELHRAGALARLITSYPRFAAARFGVPRSHVSSVLTTELMRRGWLHVPRVLQAGFDPQSYLSGQFERRAARRIPPDADVFVGWSGVSLAGIERARELGMTAIVERGSLHMLAQDRIVREEYERFGLPPVVAHPAIVEKELAEYQSADFIALPSRVAVQSFVDQGVDESKLLHIPYGVSLESFHPPEGGRRTRGRFRIVQVGGVNLRKGCQYLLEAFEKLALPDAELVFVGHVAPEMAPLRERYASDRIVFRGALPQAELVHEYGDANVFCLASLQEGFGMVVAQAMACGLPVVTTENTGARDLVHDGASGFVVPIRDADALAERLLWLYRNRDACRAMGEAARERVEVGFDWSDYGSRALRAYGRAVATNRGSELAA